MKQVFNPAVTAEVAEQIKEAAHGFQAQKLPPAPSNKRTVEGVEIRRDLPLPERQTKQGSRWEKIYKSMKVNECAVFEARRQASTFYQWGKNHGHRLSVRSVAGKFLVFRLRAPKSS